MANDNVAELELRKGKHRVVMYDNGNIWFKTPEGEHFTSASELIYISYKNSKKNLVVFQ